MSKIIKKILLITIFLAILFFSASLVFAVPPANNNQANENVDKVIEIKPPIKLEERFGVTPEMPPEQAVPKIIARLVEGFLGIIGALAVFFIVQGGFNYVLSGGSEEKIKQAKNQIMYALVGLAVAIVSFMIVETLIRVVLRAG